MKRLVADNTASIEQMIKNTAVDGREILKALEEFKFKIEQCVKISVNEEINDKIHQHYDMIDKLMSGLYTICYDMENIDLLPMYDNDQINMSDQDAPDSDNEGYNLGNEYPLPENEEEEEYSEESEGEETEESSPLGGGGGEEAVSTEESTESESEAEETTEEE
jgi:hypothetical protein